MRDLFFALFILLVPHYAMSQQDTMIVSVNGVDFVMVCVEGGTFHRGTLAAKIQLFRFGWQTRNVSAKCGTPRGIG